MGQEVYVNWAASRLTEWPWFISQDPRGFVGVKKKDNQHKNNTYHVKLTVSQRNAWLAGSRIHIPVRITRKQAGYILYG